MNNDIFEIEDDSLDNYYKNIDGDYTPNNDDFDINNIESAELNINSVDDGTEDDVDVLLYEKDPELERLKKEARELFEKIKAKNGVPEPIIVTEGGLVKKCSELTKFEQKQEFIRCALDPIYLIETYFFIFDQTRGTGGEIVNFKLFDFQKRLINDYQEHRFNISNKYRQAGISTTTCAFLAWYIMFNKNRTVAIVANKQETATNELMADVVDFIEGCPNFLKPKPTKRDSQKLKIYDNGSKVGAFNPKGLRGYTPTLLFWDEVAWTEKSDKFWEGAKPTLQTGGRAIMVSCITKDTFIYTDKGIKQIKDYIKSNELGAEIIDEYNVLGKDKLRKGNIVFKNGFVDTLKIDTTYTSLESSYNHKYWAFKKSLRKYDWYKASELEVGDYVSIQYGMEIWGNNDDCSDFKPTESKRIKNVFKPTKITPDIAYLIGLYISEGCGNKAKNRPSDYYRITISCGDDITKILNDLNLKYYTKDNLHYEISNLHLSEFLQYLGFDLSKKAPEKIIPSRVLEMSRENIIAMIQGIMDGDGWACASTNRNMLKVGIGLSSKELIDQLRILFNNFGILTEYYIYNTKPTKKVKVYSINYRIAVNSEFAETYLNKIGFRFKRKQDISLKFSSSNLGHAGIYNNIPNGGEILLNLYNKIKYYGKLNELEANNIKIRTHVHKPKEYLTAPSSRKVLLKFIDYERERLPKEYLDELSINVSPNIMWTPIKSITKSKNHTYDFSLPNLDNDPYEFGHSVVYNQLITHQTPNGQDSTFYKTFDGAKNRKGINDFNAVELWWFNDPRYNKGLEWVKNKGYDDEIRIKDDSFTDEKRIKLMEDKWEATCPWFESQVRNANGDRRKIAQEILCVEYKSIITIRNKYTGKIENIQIGDLFYILSKFSTYTSNYVYQILNSSGYFVDFGGIKRSKKSNGYKVTLGDDRSIIVSENHVFIASNTSKEVKSLIPNVSYLTTDHGDLFVKSIENVGECDFYDIVDSEDYEYYANGISNHNCSFLGSGDNFIDETFLNRIETREICKPIREEYNDKQMHIFEDPIEGEDYIMTIDVSSGHGDDNSTINILKYKEYIEIKNIVKNGVMKKVKLRKFTFTQSAEYMGKITPQDLGRLAHQYGLKYNYAYTIIDITGGIGSQTVTTMLELGYENMHYSEIKHKASRDLLDGYIKRSQKQLPDGSFVEVDLIPGFFIGGNRGSVLLELQRCINMAEIIIKSDRTLSELKTFMTVKGARVADHKRTYHDDSIMGIAIGLYVVNYDMYRFNNKNDNSKKLMDIMCKLNQKKDENKKQRLPYNTMNPNHPNSQYGWMYKGLNKRR